LIYKVYHFQLPLGCWQAELAALLEGRSLNTYVLRNGHDHALGFCEFDRHAFPQVELKNFGLIPEAQGRGLGPWLLSVALREEWTASPARSWLHTDTWDHPAAIRVYERAGFRVYAVHDQPAGPLCRARYPGPQRRRRATVIEYLHTPPDRAKRRALLAAMKISARELLRRSARDAK